MLTPRTIPQMTDSITRFSRIRKAEGIDADDGFLKGESPLLIPSHTKCKILIDQDHLTVGMPSLTVSNGEDATIRITYAETLFDKDGWKGDRNRVEGKVMKGIYDVIHHDGVFHNSRQHFSITASKFHNREGLIQQQG